MRPAAKNTKRFTPATVLVDLSVGYNTGDMFTNSYLHNINITFTVTNLLDKDPPVTGTFSGFLGYAGQVNTQLFDVLGRRFTLGVKFAM